MRRFTGVVANSGSFGNNVTGEGPGLLSVGRIGRYIYGYGALWTLTDGVEKVLVVLEAAHKSYIFTQ